MEHYRRIASNVHEGMQIERHDYRHILKRIYCMFRNRFVRTSVMMHAVTILCTARIQVSCMYVCTETNTIAFLKYTHSRVVLSLHFVTISFPASITTLRCSLHIIQLHLLSLMPMGYFRFFVMFSRQSEHTKTGLYNPHMPSSITTYCNSAWSISYYGHCHV